MTSHYKPVLNGIPFAVVHWMKHSHPHVYVSIWPNVPATLPSVTQWAYSSGKMLSSKTAFPIFHGLNGISICQ